MDKMPPSTDELDEQALQSIKQLRLLFKDARPYIDACLKNPGTQFQANNLTADSALVLKQHCIQLLKQLDFTPALCNTGIPVGSSFGDETLRLIKGKILPYLSSSHDARTIIHDVFNEPADYNRANYLLSIANAPVIFSNEEKLEIIAGIKVQLINALHILSYRIAAFGMDEDVYTRAGKDEALITPFIEQNHEITELINNIEAGNHDKCAEDIAQVRLMLKQCTANIEVLDKAAENNGTSLRQTFILRKLELLITRVNDILPVICETEAEPAFTELFALITSLILTEIKPKKLWDFVSRNVNLIAFRITENKRKTGEMYVASGKAEYWDLFISACGGGFIVSFMVLVKLFMHEMHLPILWEGILYSLNYAIGFAIIHMLHFTLATKQPAMTAAFLAASLDDIKDDSSRYHHLATTVAKVSRSQLVSFIGNLIIVFPCALLWIYVLNKIGHKDVIDNTTAISLLNGVHATHSLSFWYASIAGFFLFFAGIISGFGDNKVVVSRIGERLQAHPLLKKFFSYSQRQRIASYFEKNLGPLLGNSILGFMLGMAGFIGSITGLPFDIRHITFSMGNIALGFYGAQQPLSIQFVLLVLLGIFIIGLFNFFVSFFLAIQVAARSRGLRLKDYPDVMAAILNYFKSHPASFFYPEKQPIPQTTT